MPSRESLYHPAIVGIFEKNLTVMIRQVRAAGAIPVVATFAGCDGIEPNSPASGRCMQYVKEQIPPRDYTLARRGMQLDRDLTREIASREQAILIDLAEIIPKDPSLFTDTVHFSAAGEQRVAAAVAEGLLRSEQVRGLFEGLSR